MRTTATVGEVKDLVEAGQPWPYGFVERTLDPGAGTPFRAPAATSSHVVVEGEVEVTFLGADGVPQSKRYRKFEGWHAFPGSIYRVAAAGSGRASLVEAGTRLDEATENDEHELLRATEAPRPCVDASDYTVTKPWGHEVWYTENLDAPEYALKQIHMKQGNKSSLQSHRFKVETNYVIDGEATVINGGVAPGDLDAVIDVSVLPTSVCGQRQGWTSAANVIHRVIARTDYTSVEVSTPELDDVVRWQDDTGRSHGRIDTEHVATGV